MSEKIFYSNGDEMQVGDEAILRCLHYDRDENGIFSLPGVLSRKKQLLPQMLAVLSELDGSA